MNAFTDSLMTSWQFEPWLSPCYCCVMFGGRQQLCRDTNICVWRKVSWAFDMSWVASRRW